MKLSTSSLFYFILGGIGNPIKNKSMFLHAADGEIIDNSHFDLRKNPSKYLNMTSANLTGCADADGSCWTSCNSDACGGTPVFQAQYAVLHGGDVMVDCGNSTDFCCYTVVDWPNVTLDTIDPSFKCDDLDDAPVTKGVFEDCLIEDSGGDCDIECPSLECNVTSAQSDHVVREAYGYHVPTGGDLSFDCTGTEGAFCFVRHTKDGQPNWEGGLPATYYASSTSPTASSTAISDGSSMSPTAPATATTDAPSMSSTASANATTDAPSLSPTASATEARLSLIPSFLAMIYLSVALLTCN